jgi:PAS domain-containing protein
VPRLRLDREGLIQDGNAAARRTLEHGPDDNLQSTFFSYVHGRNLRRVMQDLVHMVNHGLQRTRWLLRLRTGTDRWRWYRAAVRNQLSSEGEILVSLHPFGPSRRTP